jgi:hypothetical protein
VIIVRLQIFRFSVQFRTEISAETERLNDTETEMHTETETFRSLLYMRLICPLAHFFREFAEIIRARIPDFCLAGKSKLREIDEELKRLNFSPDDEQKPLNYRIQVTFKKIHFIITI